MNAADKPKPGKKPGKKAVPKAEKVSFRKGGWYHPLAIVLGLVSLGWFVGAYFAQSTRDFPKIGTVPVLSGIGGWNWLVAVVLGFVAISVADRTRGPRDNAGGWRYAGPAMVACGVVGLLWIVVFYVIANTDVRIPYYSDLGQWNILIGMGFIVAAFGLATKWE